ncbi:tetratricopeptide repeat protein [Bailinhaonella thermotolerans]|uniref:tetratricopeptide repeat protein n=1 Tax=Bailinhaonella thermotolerans TaxID=1070861 RepID=UPI002412F09E|nr:hypothetical protein [Bailinhaonella thermotolerans]
MTATPQETEAETGDADRCEQARKLAESGDLEAAERLFAEIAADPDTPRRAQAAVGLAVVRDARGDFEGAREAARAALATGRSEYAAQAAYILARGFEREDLPDQARAAWQAVVGAGDPRYLPAAHLALARLAAETGADEDVDAPLRAAVATRDPRAAGLAARQLAERLLEDDDPGEALRIVRSALEIPGVADHASLRTLAGIAHLELACRDLAEAAADEEADPATTALAIELLARTLPLRGRDEDAEDAWHHGLDHPDPEVAEDVHSRLRRGLDDGPRPWWHDYVELAASSGTLPALTDELFAALDTLYSTGDLDDYVWTPALQAAHAPPPETS